MSALHQAVEYRNGGMGDSASVAKVAAAQDFNKDQTQRLLEAYNTAKTVYFFKAADDRRQDFGLADPSEVFSTMFTPEPEVKLAVDGLHDYSCYEIPEAQYYTDVTVDHAGNRPFDFGKAAEAEPAALTNRYTENQRSVRSMKRAAVHCRDTAEMCSTKYNRALDRISAEIVSGDFEGTKLAQAEHAFWELYGKELTAPVVEDLVAHLPAAYQQKRAASSCYGTLTTFDRQHPEMMGLMKEAMQARLGFAEMYAAASVFDKEADAQESGFMKAAGLLVEPVVDDFDDMIPANLRLNKAAQATTTSWSDLGAQKKTTQSNSILDAMAGGVTKNIGKAVGASAGAAAQDVFSPPNVEGIKTVDRLKNLQRQLILDDLLANDPVLAGEEAPKILAAYQSLWQVAPEVSMNKEVVRSVLRAASQAVSVSPYDAKSWAELENEVRKQVEFGGKPKAKAALV